MVLLMQTTKTTTALEALTALAFAGETAARPAVRAARPSAFAKWLDTLIAEKGIDASAVFTVEGPTGANFMAYSVVLDAMKTAPFAEQKRLKAMLVRIDFVNGDVRRYLRHLAAAIAL